MNSYISLIISLSSPFFELNDLFSCMKASKILHVICDSDYQWKTRYSIESIKEKTEETKKEEIGGFFVDIANSFNYNVIDKLYKKHKYSEKTDDYEIIYNELENKTLIIPIKEEDLDSIYRMRFDASGFIKLLDEGSNLYYTRKERDCYIYILRLKWKDLYRLYRYIDSKSDITVLKQEKSVFQHYICCQCKRNVPLFLHETCYCHYESSICRRCFSANIKQSRDTGHHPNNYY